MIRFTLSLFLAAALTGVCSAQNFQMPKVAIKDINGNAFNTADIKNNGKPIIISFWATWCKPCIAELTALAESYDELAEETGVKVVAISIDDVRNLSKVGPFVNGKAWTYDVYCDPNGDLKRAMGVNNVPHTFVLDGNLNIVWQHNSYNPGDEEELMDFVRSISKS